MKNLSSAESQRFLEKKNRNDAMLKMSTSLGCKIQRFQKRIEKKQLLQGDFELPPIFFYDDRGSRWQGDFGPVARWQIF